MALGTGNISLQDVVNEIEGEEGPDFLPTESLATVFDSNYNNSDGFDATYNSPTDNRLSEFKGYDHTAQAVTYTISPSFSNFSSGVGGLGSSASPKRATGETFILTYNVNPDPNSVSGNVSFRDIGDGNSWGSFPNSDNNGLQDGDTCTLSIAGNAINGGPRQIGIRVTGGPNVTNTPRDYIYYQAAGREYNEN